MEIPAHIIRFAKDTRFPTVEYVGRWNEYAVYSGSDPDFPYVGMPQYVLSKEGDKPRWATPDETEEIMQHFS